MSATPDGHVISVRDLTMAYGSTRVLEGIDLDVEAGGVTALLGPNGAGKTTTIEILEGFRGRSGGEVRVLGEDPAKASRAWRSRVGIVMQSWQDHARWRVVELVRYAAAHYDHPVRAEEALEMMGLGDKAQATINQLSGGQRRRLDVALGIVGRPELLFLDEPTAGFDPAARRSFHEVLGTLVDSGLTVLLTTHDLAEAERLSRRIVLLVRGHLVADGSAADLARAVDAPTTVRWREDGEVRTEQTVEPDALVHRLYATHGSALSGVEVRPPDLEDAYLEIVAREEA
ncbi:ABC-type multidrug transport system, ATPase component [Sanguibacter keddieii DSM 10542]|uniref:ABC-type multidrug transport system, ATPase component n=1 Tax=Sanguibacter keddieii (strain ATCC 51767 / DSM 10542 / NCFB 3025 / ST-74) TaxID=446469 RepID=D1BDY1_SANKS|nr:ABC transporter ATP-binding protein [Sanguibacter keddieii]ACZ23202.1 ABC-type multidrug transport system, ATPase component [Sanguibacter keddieii DSM 10542]